MRLIRTIAMAASAIGLAASGGAFAKPVASSPPASALFSAAATRIDITPADLTNLNPFGGGSFVAVHDPIHARLLLLADGATRALVVTFDVPEVGDMTPFRRRIEQETGIPFDHILLAATHNHSAPRIGGISPGTHAQRPVAESFAYSETVYAKVLAAIKTTQAALRPARLGYARGHLDINVNRDVYTPGKGWGLGTDPDGISDDGLPVIRIDGADGKPIAILFAYGVHSTVTFGLKYLTDDLAGAAERHIETYGDDGVVAMFLMGAAGEQVPIVSLGQPRPESAAFRERAFKAMEAQGFLLGAEVLRLAQGINPADAAVRIRAATRETACPTKVTAGQMATISADASPEVTVKLSALLLGDIAIGGVGGEVVTPIYRRLMRETPLMRTVFATNVNDRIGYIVDDAAYDRPTFEVNGSPVARGCAENAIVDGLTTLFRQLDR
ncbi:hypothetical protein H7F51_07675 [Novosphingobium flavum]|uniref:Neutral/alkaline non-lysosomal ceramidase N-terminal domain-containing protein n=1 Tax=Novosphingobium flavum TaxID=1778672 RepID=A0A7X1KLA3_9SPHN|nr:hypothetical protein [Novosphingobium flavum]MBC2665396.1 hypothetical protein [Novosphingobium flavum]